MKPGWWSVLLLLSGLMLVVDFSLTPLVGMETDIYWHLAAGKRFFEHGLELSDPFSVNFYGRFWIRIDWLFQVAVYAIYDRAGIDGLLVARSAVFVVSALLLAYTLRQTYDVTETPTKLEPPVSWGRTLMIILVTAHIWTQAAGLRPATLSTLFMALWILLLEQARLGQTRRLWLLPPLMVVWYNFHVAALAGVLMLGLYSFGQLVDWLAFHQPRPSRLWLGIIPLTLAGALITPQPGKLLIYPIQFLLVKTPWNQIITEVQAPSWGWPGTAETRLLLALAALGALAGLRRGQSTGVWLCLVCGYLVGHTYRHQFQLCTVLAPLAAQAMQRVPFPTRLGRLLLSGVAILLATRAAVSVAAHKLPLSGLIRHESYPEAAAAWIHRFPAGTRVFTDMNYGGYFLWKFEGLQRVFIDSRTDQVYSVHQFVWDYLTILVGERQGPQRPTEAAARAAADALNILFGVPEALQLLDQYGLDVVVVQILVSGPDGKLSRMLSRRDSGWTCHYADYISQVFVRTKGEIPGGPKTEPEPYLTEYIQGEKDNDLDAFYRSLALYPHFSAAHLYIARIWMAKNLPGPASREVARAQLDNPDTPGLAEEWKRWGAVSGHTWLANWAPLHWYALPFLGL